MRKVLTPKSSPKRRARKVADALSAALILLTVLSLLGVTIASYSFDNRTQKANGFAIYKGDPEKQEAGLMFNVYEGAENVRKILGILRDYSAKATFFIGGIWAEKNTETLLEIAMEGHELACHGYLHRDHAKMTIEQNKEEIFICSRLIENVTGNHVTLFAPPSGSFGKNTETACRELGMKMILWTKDTIDWRDNDVPLLIKRATKNMEKGDLILMHPKTQTVSALPKIIESYQREGFSLVPVSEMLR